MARQTRAEHDHQRLRRQGANRVDLLATAARHRDPGPGLAGRAVRRRTRERGRPALRATAERSNRTDPRADRHPTRAVGTRRSHHLRPSLRGHRPQCRALFAAAADSPNPFDGRLAELLGTTADKVPSDLGQVGQELAFYLAADPELYRRFEDAVSAEQDDGTVDDVREQLLKQGVSQALEVKLSR